MVSFAVNDHYSTNNMMNMKLYSSSSTGSDKYKSSFGWSRKMKKVAQVLLLIAIAGYSFFLLDEDEYSNGPSSSRRRAMLVSDDREDGQQRRRRQLVSTTRNGISPPDTDVADDLYIVKPVVGYASSDVLEATNANGPTLLGLPSTGHSASSTTPSYPATNAVDSNSTSFWQSGKASDAEYLTIDLGIPEHIREVLISFPTAGTDLDFELQLSYDKDDESSWTTLESYSAFTGTSITYSSIPEEAIVGRYLRLYFTSGYMSTGGYPPGRFYSVSNVQVWRMPRVIGSNPTSTPCGDSLITSKDSLLQQHGGTLDTLYENIEFFSVSLTEAQADSMRNDPCAYAVERNWIVRPRGRFLRRQNQESWEYQIPQEEVVPQGFVVPQEDEDYHGHRRLGIPDMRRLETDFCMEYEPNSETDEFRQCLVVNGTEYMKPGSWGLQRISSRGRLKGKYLWVNEGFGTNSYIFDTGVYPDSMDWIGRNVTYMTHGPSRLESPYVCAGDASDLGQYSNHGTHVASITAGYEHGLAKMSAIHPIQVIDGATGFGSVASILCGLDKVIQDGIDHAAGTTTANEEDYWESRQPVQDVRQWKAVINLSVGVDGRSDVLDQAVKDVVDLGYATVVAAGDSAPGLGGGNSCHYSPTHPDAIRVGALQNGGAYSITINGKKSMYIEGSGLNDKAPDSNYGECIDIWAPGDEIVGASNTGAYDEVMMSGTSVAAAFVSGAATHFLEEFDGLVANTQTQWGSRVKEKMIARSERGLGDLGHSTTNDLSLQTTASMCQKNSDCNSGTCLPDGACGDMNKFFSMKGLSPSAFKPSPPPTPKPVRYVVSEPVPLPTMQLNAILSRWDMPTVAATSPPSTSPVLGRDSACRGIHVPFFIKPVYPTNEAGWIEINVNPLGTGKTANPDTVSAPRWSNACSRIGSPGDCAWFVTAGQDNYWSTIVGGESYYEDESGQTESENGFAYRVCKATDADSDCGTNGDIELTDICASHYDGDSATLLTSEYLHAWNQERGRGTWLNLWQGKIFEQEGVCISDQTSFQRDSFHVDWTNEQMTINIKPVNDQSSVLQGQWSDVCSKISTGQCSWFHTGTDIEWLGLSGESSYSTTPNIAGSYQWPEFQDFAYRVCKTTSSSTCTTNGDLELSSLCTSRPISDVDYSPVTTSFDHTFDQNAGSGMWYTLYEGAISSAGVWRRYLRDDITSTTADLTYSDQFNGIAKGLVVIRPGQYMTYNVNFGSEKYQVGQMKIRYSKSPPTAGRLDIVLGSNTNGQVIGTYNPPHTGSWFDYVEVYIPISPGDIEGIQTITLKHIGAQGEGPLFFLEYWELAPPSQYIAPPSPSPSPTSFCESNLLTNADFSDGLTDWQAFGWAGGVLPSIRLTTGVSGNAVEAYNRTTWRSGPRQDLAGDDLTCLTSSVFAHIEFKTKLVNETTGEGIACDTSTSTGCPMVTIRHSTWDYVYDRNNNAGWQANDWNSFYGVYQVPSGGFTTAVYLMVVGGDPGTSLIVDDISMTIGDSFAPTPTP